MLKNRKTYIVAWFTLICFLYSWPIFFCVDSWLEPMFSQQGNLDAAGFSVLLGHLFAMLGPALAAFWMWRFVHKQTLPAWKWGQRKHYLWVMLAMLAFWVLPGLIELFLGGKIATPLETQFWVSLLLMLCFGWIAGMGEEIGWCAYLLPELSPTLGKTRALIVSSILRGLWHWPVVVGPVIAQVIAGERTLAELLGASIVIAFQLVVSNILFGSIFGWLWYRTESIPLVGWMHYWYDFARDVTLMLVVGYGSSLWVTQLNAFVLFPLGFVLLDQVLKGEGLDWKRFLKQGTALSSE